MTRTAFETETIGYKKSLSELKEGILTLTAMLNKNGHGTVYFGIDDKKNVIGVDIGKDTLKNITSTMFDSTDPHIIPRVEVIDMDGKNIIQVSAEGNNRPYAYRSTVYIRTGEEDRKAPMDEIRRMFRSSGDLLVQTVAMNQDLTFEGLKRVLSSRGKHVMNEDTFIGSCGLRNDLGSYNIQAQLLSDQNDAQIIVTVFKGTDRTEFSKRRTFSGRSLVEIVEMVRDYVDSLNEVSVKVDADGRIDTPLFDIDAFKEAWVNACVHNSWMQGTPPFVQMFDDRLEICSFGGIPYWLSQEDFFEGVSQPVNESLMNVFLMCDISEHTGHGVPEIVRTYGRDCYDLSEGMVRVTMRFKGERSVVRIRESNSISKGLELTEMEMKIVRVMMDDPRSTMDDIAEITNIKRSTIGKYSRSLQEKGIIRREGSKKMGKWVVLIDRLYYE